VFKIPQVLCVDLQCGWYHTLAYVRDLGVQDHLFSCGSTIRGQLGRDDNIELDKHKQKVSSAFAEVQNFDKVSSIFRLGCGGNNSWCVLHRIKFHLGDKDLDCQKLELFRDLDIL